MRKLILLLPLILAAIVVAASAETLPPLQGGHAPQTHEELWAGFDPRAEPLDVEMLREWEEDNVALRIVRFRIGIFKGQKATLAAVYGFPKDAARSGKKLPGLVQIHGGGQFADYKACLLNAKRGYATLSIAWAGRISAPNYRVSPAEVKLFWDGKTEDPNYKLTTDWGAVDGYHAPGRNPGNVFPSARAAAWTLDAVESPRNSGWFLCALAARRALTFLEQQPEVNPERLGVYGHSMGGKLTVMTAFDPRVKAAAPSCGGISDRYNDSPLFRATIGDDVSLKRISCPIIFLSPANDFHGRIGDLPDAIRDIASKDWRVTCSPHHNHQDTPPYEVATLLWFDQHLKGSFAFPKTPETALSLKTSDGVPVFSVKPDPARPVASVDIFYTQHGATEQPEPIENAKHRFWHHAPATASAGVWTASLPLGATDKPLWVYANVVYLLAEPVTGAGYYYGLYTAQSFNVSSALTTISPTQLREAGVRATLRRSLVIEDFEGDWQKNWFTYKPEEWARTTHKLNDATWHAPPGARLSLGVRSTKPNKLIVLIDDHAAEVPLDGGGDWQTVTLSPGDFRDIRGGVLPGWDGVQRLTLSPNERLRSAGGGKTPPRILGGNWDGAPPQFRALRWTVSTDTSTEKAPPQRKQRDD